MTNESTDTSVDPSAPTPTKVVILVMDQADLLDVGGPYEVLLTANRLAERDGRLAPFSIEVASLDGHPVTVYGGMGVVPTTALDTASPDVVVVPGAIDLDVLTDAELVGSVAAAAQTSVMTSVCTGAFALGAAGLLAGRRWTTHAEDLDALGDLVGHEGARSGVPWVDEGSVITAGGLTNGLGLGLRLVERFADRALAERTGRQLDYRWNPDSGITTEDAPDAGRPDLADWTWILERGCQECNVTVHELDMSELRELLDAVTDAWTAVLGRSPTGLRARPEPDVWSPLEYAAHACSVIELTDHRLSRILDEETPEFPDVNPNTVAEAERFDLADPRQLVNRFETARGELAATIARVNSDELDRPGVRSNGSQFTALTLTRYGLHDPAHHLADVGATCPSGPWSSDGR